MPTAVTRGPAVLPKTFPPGRSLQQKRDSLPFQEHVCTADNQAAVKLQMSLRQELSDWNIAPRCQTPRGCLPAATSHHSCGSPRRAKASSKPAHHRDPPLSKEGTGPMTAPLRPNEGTCAHPDYLAVGVTAFKPGHILMAGVCRRPQWVPIQQPPISHSPLLKGPHFCSFDPLGHCSSGRPS